MNQNNDHDFQQFRGQFDDAMVPDASFKAKMEKLLQSEKPAQEERTSTVLASPSREQSETVVPTRRSHPLMIAIAVLMVFSVVIASVWVLSGDVLEGEYASAPSGIATLPADAPGTPGTDVDLIAEKVPGTEDAAQLHGVFDGIAVFQTRGAPPESAQEDGLATPPPLANHSSLVAVDVDSGERLWEFEQTYMESILHADDILVGYQHTYGRFGEVYDRELSAINLRSGDVLWEVAIADTDAQLQSSRPVNPVMIRDLIVLPNADGDVVAWDVETGEIAWETSFDPGTGDVAQFRSNEDQSEEIRMRNIAITVWRDQIMILNGDGLLRVLNPENGETTGSGNLFSTESERFSNGQVGLYPLPDGVLLVRDMSNADSQRSETIVFNPDTGETKWAEEFDGHLNISVSNDGTIAMTSPKWERASWLLQIFGQPGYSTNEFRWLDGKSGEEILRTARSRATEYHFATTDGTYACTRANEEEAVCFDEVGTRHLIEIMPGTNPVIVNGVLYIPSQQGLYRVELP